MTLFHKLLPRFEEKLQKISQIVEKIVEKVWKFAETRCIIDIVE